MKKTASLLCILLVLASLSAQERVPSNSIGQDRGRFSDTSVYTLSIQDDTTELYHEEIPVWKESRTRNGDVLEIETFNFASDSTHLKRYENTRLITEGDGEQMRYFYYDASGLMVKSMLLSSEKLVEMELYTYDAGTKTLNAILTVTSEGSSISYFGDPIGRPWFSFTSGDTFTKVTQISQNLQIQEIWLGDARIKSVQVEMPQGGGIRLTTTTERGEESELYDNRGLLVSRITPSLATEYLYNDERTLIEVREESLDFKRRILRYEEGRKVSESIYQDGTLEKETRFPDGSGKVETLYDSGLPYCDITYALDGKRVLSIRYR